MDYKEISDYAASLDRAYFIDNENRIFADVNEPLPIGFGQTISQPSLVVEMSYLLSPERDKTVLEIGTGSGYQTAILAHFSKHVYTAERIPELGKSARTRLESLGFSNISFMIGDASEGWKEYAPFDRIMVTAAAGKMPDELLDQLNNNGIMVIPIGPRGMQELFTVTKGPKGEIHMHAVECVRFVEMKGKYGWYQDT